VKGVCNDHQKKKFLRGAGISGAAIAVNGPIFNSLALAETSTASENGNGCQLPVKAALHGVLPKFLCKMESRQG
jgi:hypothetical protein